MKRIIILILQILAFIGLTVLFIWIATVTKPRPLEDAIEHGYFKKDGQYYHVVPFEPNETVVNDQIVRYYQQPQRD